MGSEPSNTDTVITPRRLFFRVLAVIVGVVSFHIIGIEFLVYFVMVPSAKEFALMLLYPLPLAAALVGTYIFITYRYISPVSVFLKQVGTGGDISPNRSVVAAAQDRCINLPYFLALLSFPAYIAGGAGGVWIVGNVLGWPSSTVVYGLLAGMIAGLLTIPMSEYFTGVAVKPAITALTRKSAGFDRARRAGIRVSLRMKFFLIVVVMVVGVTGYAVIIGYSMVNRTIVNMEQIENLLPPESAALLADHSLGSSDNRVKSSSYFNSLMGSLKMFFAGIILVGSLLASGVSLAAANAITRPLSRFSEVAVKIRNGDYKESIDIITNDEFAELGSSFNRMTSALLAQLQNNRMLLETISEAVGVLTPMSRELVEATELQSDAGRKQAESAQEASDIGREIAKAAHRIAENASHGTRESETTMHMINEGWEKLEQTERRLEDIAGRMNMVAEAVSDLENQSVEINNIVEIIKDIGGKTNILSINASIEAIKAGEHGQSFGVVAREIRNLARNSSQSAKSIRVNIEQIRNTLSMVIYYTRMAEQSVSAGKQTMMEMKQQFDRIIDASQNTVSELESIEIMTSRQAQTNEKLSNIVSRIREVAKKSAASEENIHNVVKRMEALISQLQRHTSGKQG